ncbi:MAG: Plug domain-containing protein [Gemmatimonadota bacterium]
MSLSPIPIRHVAALLRMEIRAAALLAALLALGPPASGQVIPDTIPPPPDTLQVETPEDTLGLQEAQADSINPQDTLPAVIVPELIRPVTEGWNTGIWEFDRDEILGSKAITLGELLEEIPGLVLLRGGDYGSPVAVSAFGVGGGRVRVFRDGIEFLPLEGSVSDLARVGVAGLRSIRVIRSVGELRIELESVLSEGGRPYSLIEAGTGDLNSNLFRGTFSHPRALGGIVALTMERVDTRGPRGEEPGVTQGAWLRYAKSLFGRGALLVDYGSRSSDRGELFGPGKASRADWSVRTRWGISSKLVGDLYYSSSSISTEEPDTFAFGTEARTQIGAHLTFGSEWIQAAAHLRKLSGEGLPETTAHLEAQGLLGRYGGVSGELSWDRWDGGSVNRNRFRIWTAPVYGLSLFAERGSGEFGFPYLPKAPLPPPDPEAEPSPPDSTLGVLPGPRFSDQSGSRYGAEFRWRGLSLAGALLKTEADSLFLLGLPTDRAGATQAGGSRDGFEVSGRIPLYPKGFSLVGWWQKWDQAEDVYTTPADSTAEPELVSEAQVPWRYLPRQSYQASLSFHDTFKDTGNLEIWFDLGVRGRDPMAVPFPLDMDWGEEEPRMVPSMAPFYQSWYVRLQIRIVTVRAFFMWENFTVRDQNQDYPGRILPATRSLYGVRWTLWN